MNKEFSKIEKRIGEKHIELFKIVKNDYSNVEELAAFLNEYVPNNENEIQRNPTLKDNLILLLSFILMYGLNSQLNKSNSEIKLKIPKELQIRENIFDILEVN